jgi:hypothetical protein
MKRQKFKGARGKGYLKGEGVMGNVVWMATNDEIIDNEEMEWDVFLPDEEGRIILNKMLNNARLDVLRKLERSVRGMYRDSTSGENGGTVDQEGLARALGLIESEALRLIESEFLKLNNQTKKKVD